MHLLFILKSQTWKQEVSIEAIIKNTLLYEEIVIFNRSYCKIILVYEIIRLFTFLGSVKLERLGGSLSYEVQNHVHPK
jgi:hypothetical protein